MASPIGVSSPRSSALKVYLAGSTQDIERAKRWRDALVSAGVEVVSTWIEVVEKVGSGNPQDATKVQRADWSTTDLAEVASADVLWLLVPPADKAARGAWLEFGYAVERRITLISSGDTRQSIFTAMGIELETDEDAFYLITGSTRSPPALGGAYGATIFGVETALPAVAAKAGVNIYVVKDAEIVDQNAWRKDAGDSLATLAAQLSDRGFAIELTPSMGVEYPGPLILEIIDHSPNPSKVLIPSHTTTYYRLLKTVDAFLAGLRRR